MEQILEQIETTNAKVEEIRLKLPEITKIQLHTGLQGYESPKVFGIYKKGIGGNCLGVSRDSYTPMNLNLLLDVIVNSVTESNLDIDLSKLEYNEYKEGKKVTFSLPLKKYELETPLVGDVMETKLVFKTGFDTLTKSSVSYFTKRLVCSNGAARYDNGYRINYKNTKNNADKYLMFTDEILKTEMDLDNYIQQLNRIAKKPINTQQINEFYMLMFGISKDNYTESHKRSQNILDKINKCVAIEEKEVGMTAFALLSGITRYTTHYLTEDDMDLMFSNAAIINQNAHSLIFNLN